MVYKLGNKSIILLLIQEIYIYHLFLNFPPHNHIVLYLSNLFKKMISYYNYVTIVYSFFDKGQRNDSDGM